LRAEPKNFFGLVTLSTPRARHDPAFARCKLYKAGDNRVMLSSKINVFFQFHQTFSRSSTNSALAHVDERSRRSWNDKSGNQFGAPDRSLFRTLVHQKHDEDNLGMYYPDRFAISLSKIVCPPAAAHDQPRCPRPSGARRSTARALIEFVFGFSSIIRPCGNCGVNLSKSTGSVHRSAGSPSIVITSSSASRSLPVARQTERPRQPLAGTQVKLLYDRARHTNILGHRQKIQLRIAK